MRDPGQVSREQAAASLVVLLVVPPLAPIVWIALSGPDRGAYMRSWTVRAGIGVIVLVVAPLIWVLATAPSNSSAADRPNPIGLGLLFAAGSLLGTVLMMVGVTRTWLRFRRRAQAA